MQLDSRNGLDVFLTQRMEYHDFVDAVDELRPEMRLDLGHHRQLDNPVIIARHLLDHL